MYKVFHRQYHPCNLPINIIVRRYNAHHLPVSLASDILSIIKMAADESDRFVNITVSDFSHFFSHLSLKISTKPLIKTGYKYGFSSLLKCLSNLKKLDFVF